MFAPALRMRQPSSRHWRAVRKSRRSSGAVTGHLFRSRATAATSSPNGVGSTVHSSETKGDFETALARRSFAGRRRSGKETKHDRNAGQRTICLLWQDKVDPCQSTPRPMSLESKCPKVAKLGRVHTAK